ncbi:MAG: bifunctional methylenetetrahydrofolate dehydrogenase/methenyltetrahydrofolate cyclohydrolase FolD [Solirubrobacterales bacterium]|nr:bifunctional methylenetetrahydrofolate dehydrogenase/methenyltetrahydrofolate cyclohydrolase FolD [Solirubrobacterales bacterium]OJU94069.1 MAG: bifunctional 5,10-methylene-tetrahydrofolate dehydrogenase/5,10-methylene-tetrahydrofolate cyclohydrolase [Solirubrobacterales bacterium 67-14]
MSAKIIDGKQVSVEVRERVAEQVEQFIAGGGHQPVLATVLVGDDPASHIYVANKHKACEAAGIGSVHHELPAETSQEDLVTLVKALGDDDDVDGILVQLPPPDHIDPDAVIEAINPAKDVDGLTATNAGLLAGGRPGLVPCTPAGVIELLDHAGIGLEGAEAVIVGRSNLVGRPMISLLLGRNATVTCAHSRTRDLAEVTRRADILVVAVGVPELVKRDGIKPGATVIDVGMNRTEGGLKGDVDFEAAAEVAGAITPVPGGVGPMTIAMLMANTLTAAKARTR